MSPSFDISSSSLLCEEEEDYGIFSDSESSEPVWRHRDRRLSGLTDDFNGGDSMTEFPVQSDECVLEMVKKEIEHLGESDYLSRLRNGDLDLVSRIEAIHWILKVIDHYNFGPLCAYLAVSYLDRFLSAYHLPTAKAWMMQLLAVACLSLAAKMEENEVPLSLNLQVAESKFVFEAKTIQRMELVVLSTLKWRMQAITPFSFIDHFLYKINGEKYSPKSTINLSTQLILSIIRGIEFLEYRPSEIAAAVAVSVSVGLESQTVEVDKSIYLLIEYAQKDRVLKCLKMIHESSKETDEGLTFNLTPCVPHNSPIGVLEITCLSYQSEESTVECANSTHISLGTKRRKLLV